jgi:hypothetical protein
MPIERKRIWLAVALLVLGAAVVCAMNWRSIRREFAIDKCLDAGGCWNDAASTCEFKHQALCKPLQ